MKLTAYALTAMAVLALSSCTTTPADPNERPATKDEITSRAVGHTINGKLKYNTDGTYQYIGGNSGRYTISEGKICIKFNDGGSRCDRITVNGLKYFLINAGGQRYPWG